MKFSFMRHVAFVSILLSTKTMGAIGTGGSIDQEGTEKGGGAKEKPHSAFWWEKKPGDEALFIEEDPLQDGTGAVNQYDDTTDGSDKASAALKVAAEKQTGRIPFPPAKNVEPFTDMKVPRTNNEEPCANNEEPVTDMEQGGANKKGRGAKEKPRSWEKKPGDAALFKEEDPLQDGAGAVNQYDDTTDGSDKASAALKVEAEKQTNRVPFPPAKSVEPHTDIKVPRTNNEEPPSTDIEDRANKKGPSYSWWKKKTVDEGDDGVPDPKAGLAEKASEHFPADIPANPLPMVAANNDNRTPVEIISNEDSQSQSTFSSRRSLRSSSRSLGSSSSGKGKKSQSPSTSPSTLPSQSPSTSPSTLPSQSPSTFGSRFLLMCLLDDGSAAVDELFTDTTVDDVNSALVKIGGAVDKLLNSDATVDHQEMLNAHKAVADVLHEKGSELWTSSIALSQSLTTDSEDQVTQTLILEGVKETSEKIVSLHRRVSQEFVPVRAKIVDPILDEIMLRAKSITNAYTSFIETREEPNKGDRDNSASQLRNACDSNNFRPKDMFNYIYGYACGEDPGKGKECASQGIGSTGVCPSGDKKENYFMTSFLNTANADAKTDVESFKLFGSWLLGAMAEFMYLHSVCLPPDGNACTVVADSTFEGTLQYMKFLFEEVAVNLMHVEKCVSDRPSEPATNTKIAMCAVNEQGYPVPEEAPEYKIATPVYIEEVDFKYAEETGTDVTETLGSLADGASDVLDALDIDKLKGVIGGLGALGAGLSILTHFLGKSETDLTQELIKQQFDKTNLKLDVLSNQVSDGFSDLKTDLGDARLDDLMGQLSVVKRAYDEFMLSRGDFTDDKIIKRKYAEEFRSACNDKQYKPQDIFRILYGYACGSKPRACEADAGSDKGPCKYGARNRQYLLDVFKSDANGSIPAFDKFTRWLSQAMLEAMYLHTVCLDDNPNYCPTTLSDPVFEKTLSDMTDAFTEVANNLGEVADCFCSPCRRVTIVKVKTPIDGPDAKEICTELSDLKGLKQELQIKIDDSVVFDKSVASNRWSSVFSFNDGLTRDYHAGGTGFKLGFKDKYNCGTDEEGSVQVNPRDWYDPVKCEPYEKDFYTNVGHEANTNLWGFRIKVTSGESCVDPDGNIFN